MMKMIVKTMKMQMVKISILLLLEIYSHSLFIGTGLTQNHKATCGRARPGRS